MNSARPTVLVVDDDREFCELLQDYLRTQDCDVRTAHDGNEALALCETESVDAMVLDVMMPNLDGFETLRRLRQPGSRHLTLPVVMLTARGEDIDRIVGLEMGADDYMPKPANPRELLARLRAVLRRSHPDSTADDLISTGDVELNAATRDVFCAGQRIELTSTEFDVLHVLLRYAGTVVSKEKLSQQSLGRGVGTYDRSLDMHISKLRRKLGNGPEDEPRIKTVRNKGYLYVRH